MPPTLLEIIAKGDAPKNFRMLVARGSAPLPPKEMFESLVHLLTDPDAEVSSSAAETLGSWQKEELLSYLRSTDCAPAVMEHFAAHDPTDDIIQALISNPAAPPKAVEALAQTVPASLLDKILDNRVRLLENPAILEKIEKNPNATPEIRRVVKEIEAEFFSVKKTEYALEEAAPAQEHSIAEQILLENATPPEDLFLEGLPVDTEARQSEITRQLACLPVRDKIKYALFGTREIRAVLVRDTNKEIARSVLHSPKITENEIESISAMRSVSEDILREIGNSREWSRSYIVVQNLVRNPKTPPGISQRLLPRLRARDLMQLSRDRSIPDAVRYNATRALNQRTRSPK